MDSVPGKKAELEMLQSELQVASRYLEFITTSFDKALEIQRNLAKAHADFISMVNGSMVMFENLRTSANRSKTELASLEAIPKEGA